MTAPSDLEGLLARVEGATGGDRELDARLWCLAEGQTYSLTGTDGRPNLYVCPRYTASLDAALALVERVLPGWSVNLGIQPRNVGNSARVGGDHLIGEPVGFFHASKPPALTLVIALLKALSAQSASPAGGQTKGVE